ncbi:hypothetical protein BUE80_DR008432, partial [Diplocarpon rosae]
QRSGPPGLVRKRWNRMFIPQACGTLEQQADLCVHHCQTFRQITPCCGTEQYPTLECGGVPK